MKEMISYGRIRCRELTPHRNRGMEITYIEKGLLDWVVEGTPEKVHPGSVFFTLPWQVHGSLHPREPDNITWHILFHLDEDYSTPRTSFRFPKRFGFTPAETKTLSRTLAGSSRHSFRASALMQPLIPELIRELQSTHTLREANAISLLRRILIELKRIITGETTDTDTHTASEKRVRALLNELSIHPDRAWTLPQMAGQCGIRRTQLNELFRKLTGGTPMEYLARLRMERAKTLLRKTEMKIIDVALECGFGSSQYFANTFKRAVGMTPSEYREHCVKLKAGELQKWKHIGFRSEKEERERIRSFSETGGP